MSDVFAIIVGHAFELATVVGIIGALLLSTHQNSLASRATRAQTFVDLLHLEVESGFQTGILAITVLRPYGSFADFMAAETPETQQAIYNAVVFLNFMAVLGEEGYLHMQDAWDVYFWSYRKCAEKLLPWWLAGQRVNQPNVFPSFERSCAVTELVSATQIAAFDRSVGLKHLEKYQRTSGVSRTKLMMRLQQQIPPDLG